MLLETSWPGWFIQSKQSHIQEINHSTECNQTFELELLEKNHHVDCHQLLIHHTYEFYNRIKLIVKVAELK